MKIDIPGHNLYVALHTHRHGTSLHFFAVPEGVGSSAKDLEPFMEEFDPSVEEIEVIGPITIDDIKVIDPNDVESL